jgi:hypothetical protein
MGRKFKKLMLMYEAKEIVTVVFEKGKYRLLGDEGISKPMDKKEIADLLDKISIKSLDTKSDATDAILKEVETARDNQVDLEMDSKEIKKLKLG